MLCLNFRYSMVVIPSMYVVNCSLLLYWYFYFYFYFFIFIYFFFWGGGQGGLQQSKNTLFFTILIKRMHKHICFQPIFFKKSAKFVSCQSACSYSAWCFILNLGGRQKSKKNAILDVFDRKNTWTYFFINQSFSK